MHQLLVNNEYGLGSVINASFSCEQTPAERVKAKMKLQLDETGNIVLMLFCLFVSPTGQIVVFLKLEDYLS